MAGKAQQRAPWRRPEDLLAVPELRQDAQEDERDGEAPGGREQPVAGHTVGDPQGRREQVNGRKATPQQQGSQEQRHAPAPGSSSSTRKMARKPAKKVAVRSGVSVT
ncbi:hypothetical protein GCM10025871_41710 [Deinococcus metallilatus]|nr:hypothetical protein GCM10025871_41710 [Deinococcus metallilatus]